MKNFVLTLGLFSISIFAQDSDFTKMDISATNIKTDSWGISWVDYNRDGFEDLFITDKNPEQPNQLYKNINGESFERILVGPLVNDLASSVSSSWADIDNDGHIDVFISNNQGFGDFIYRNLGDGTFEKIEDQAIISQGVHSHSAAWGDFNNDGFVDMFIGEWSDARPNKLYQNNGDGTFEQVSIKDIDNKLANSLGGYWCDFDNDGDYDLFVVNHNGSENWLYRNDDGDFKIFKDRNMDIVTDAFNSTGASWGDYDNDGDMDLFVTNASNQNNCLYENKLNDGSRTRKFGAVNFDKVTEGIIVNDAGHSHGSSWIDYNNDGWLDLFVTNDQGQPNVLYKNNGDKTFSKMEGLFDADGGQSFGNAWADIDNDGDYDCFVVNQGDQENFLYRNEIGNKNNHFKVNLEGTEGNKTAVGAKVFIQSSINGKKFWQTREVGAQTGGIGSMNSIDIIFGLAEGQIIDSVEIVWSQSQNNGQKRSIYNRFGANEEVTIVEDVETVVEEYPTEGIIALNWVYPNPTNKDVNLVYESEAYETIKVVIHDFVTQMGFINEYEVNMGRNEFYYNVEGFSNGVHLIQVHKNNTLQTIRFVKVQ